MLSRTLQWVGLAALVGLAAVGIGGLALVKDRLHIIIQPADDSARPDPLAMVRDELQVMSSDLQAIAAALDTNLAQVGAALDQSSQRLDGIGRAIEGLRPLLADETPAARERALSTLLRSEFATLRQTLQTANDTAASHGGHLAAPAATTPDESTPHAGETLADSTPTPDVPTPDAPTAQSTAQPSEPTTEHPAATASAETTPQPARFLAFQLPSAGFEFDAPNVYRILPSLSRVGFDAKSTLHDFTGVTSAIRGEVHANLADPSAAWSGSIRCTAETLNTGLEGRDEGMREHLATTEHPEIVFEVQRFVATPDSLDRAARKIAGNIEGTMTIRGVTREISMPVAISVDESQRAVVSGQLPLKLTDYGIPVPSQLGLISMEDQVNVWIELRARASRDKDARRDAK